MDACFNLLGKKCFPRLPLIGIFIFALTGAAILGTLLSKEPDEPETFRCFINGKERASDNFRDRCYKEYDKQYNKNFPLYGFALLNFPLVLLVCVVYSQCVKQRVDQLGIRNARSENPLNYSVFKAYVVHLLIRSVLMTLFLVVQWTVIYPSTFPAAFTCFDTNSTENRTSTITSDHSCKNSQARIKTISGIFLFAVNTMLLGISLAELMCLYKERNNLTTDENFCETYLLNPIIGPDVEEGSPGASQTTKPSPPISRNVPSKESIKKFQERLLEQIWSETEFIKSPIPSNEESKNWKLDETFVNLVIQTGRKNEAHRLETEDRDTILNAYMDAEPDKCTFEEPMSIFSPSKDSEDITNSPRTVLAVGRPGIGKSCLSSKILREWAKMKTKKGGQATEQTVGQGTEQVEQAEEDTKKNDEAEQDTKETDEAEQVPKETSEHVTRQSEQAGQTTEEEQAGGAEQATDQSKLMGQVEQTESAAKQAEQREQKNKAFKRAEAEERVEQAGNDDRRTEETVKHLDFAFLLEFRNLNKRISLKNLLISSLFSVNLSDEVLQHILDNPRNVLLIFDGLDEAKDISQGIKEEEKFYNRDDEEMPVGALFAKLVRGRLLPGATVLTTTRSTALSDDVVRKFYFEDVNQRQLRRVEILGFTEDKVEAFVKRFASSDRKMQCHIWDHIKTNANLLSLCYIPVNCFIVCQALQSFFERNQGTSDGQLPKTLTGIYKMALKYFIKNHDHSSYQTDEKSGKEETLRKLGMLAKQGVEEGKLIFEKTDITESAQISNEELQALADSGLLHQLPKRDNKEKYCFIHLTFQEFLAARVIANESGTKLRTFSKSVMKDLNMGMVLRFVAGLLKDRPDRKCIDNLLAPFIRKRIVTCMPCTVQTDLSGLFFSSKFLLLLQCLFELQDEERAKQVSEQNMEGRDFSLLGISDSDCGALVFSLKHSNNIGLSLHNSFIGPRGCAELEELVSNGNLEVLDKANNLGDEGVKHLKKALESKNCQLTYLNLDGNRLTDEGVQYLKEALVKPTCKLRRFSIGGNEITPLGAKHLKEALESENCKVRHLNLDGNRLTDEGVQYLKEALVKPTCKLLRFSIGGNEITPLGAKHLKEALESENCKVRHLNLDGNRLTDEGVQYLKEALVNRTCKLWSLSELSIGGNEITPLGAKHLKEALESENCQLMNLNLDGNRLTDEGVQYLKEALVKGTCELTYLSIGGNEITPLGAKHLKEALESENCRLTRLNLDGNRLTDEGVKYLKEALEKPTCKLELLSLHSNEITAVGAMYLEALESKNCELMCFYSDNPLIYEGMK